MCTFVRWVTGTLLVVVLFAFAPAARAAPAVVINELFWMGSSLSASDEWVELANTSDAPVDLAGWRMTKLSSGSEAAMLTVPAGVIPGHGFFLIANDPSERSRLAVTPDLVNASVSLVNTKLQISLYDAAGTLVDRADDGSGNPLAGSYTAGSVWKSMERNPTGAEDGSGETSWHTASASVGFDDALLEFGTPGSANSNSAPTAVLVAPESAFVGDTTAFDGSESSDPERDPLSFLWEFGDGQTDALVTPTHQYASAGTYTVTLTVRDGTFAASATASVVITERRQETEQTPPQPESPNANESAPPLSTAPPPFRLTALLPDPVGSDAQGEYIEIENTGMDEVSAARVRLADASSSYTLDASDLAVLVPAGGRLRVPRSVSGVALNNAGSETVTLTADDGTVLDSVTYTGPVQEGSVYERRADGWAWSILITPSPTSKEETVQTDPTLGVRETSSAIVLNELLPDPAGSDAEGEYVELANTGRTTVSLAGWKIVAGSREYRIANLTLEAGEIAALLHPETRIMLSNGGGTVYLVDPFGAVLQGVRYPRAPAGKAFARFGKRWQWTEPTPHAVNIRAAERPETTSSPLSTTGEKVAQRTTLAALATLPPRTLVRVEGTVIAEPNVIAERVFYIQDGAAGIRLVGDADVTVGDRVAIEGTIGHTEGERKVTLASSEDVRLLGSGNTIEAVPYATSIAGGTLVIAEGAIQKKDSSGFTLTTESGSVRVTIRPAAEIETGDFAAKDRVRVTGVLRRTKTATRLYPRSQGDVVPIGTVAGATTEVSSAPDAPVPSAPVEAGNPQTFALLGIPLLAAASALGWRWWKMRRG